MSYQNFKSDYIQFNSFDEKDSAELSKALDVLSHRAYLWVKTESYAR